VHLSVTLADAARLDDADIFVDLSGVTFMDASTVSALVGARNRLRAQSRSLSVRDPSPLARRVVDLCGLSQLIDEHPEPAASLLGTALGTWVSVPARRLRTDTAPPSITPEASAQEPADAVEEQLEPARLFQRRRAWR
jgi:anti-anti-sigma factor